MTISLQIGEKKPTVYSNVIYTTQNLHKKWNLLHSLVAGHYSNCYGYENMMDRYRYTCKNIISVANKYEDEEQLV